MQWIKRFAIDFIGIHLDGVRAVIGLRWFFIAVILWEFAQHVMEVRIGFFASREAARAVETDASRMILGWVKMGLVYIGGFLVIRYLVEKDGERIIANWQQALPRYLPYIAYSFVIFATIFYARRFIVPEDVRDFRSTVAFTQIAIEPILMPWIVAAATDGALRGPLSSAKRIGFIYLYALPLFFVTRLPINGAHYLLNKLALGQPESILWPMLIIDAVVVGLVIAVIPAIAVRVANRVEQSRDEVSGHRTSLA